jgi:hypothetical protein
MIVIGADTHKRNHTLVALDWQTGALRGQRAIRASDAGSLDALRFAAELDEDRVWAIEDCRHVSARLERALIAAGERVIRVAAGDDRPDAQGLSRGREVRSDQRARQPCELTDQSCADPRASQ